MINTLPRILASRDRKFAESFSPLNTSKAELRICWEDPKNYRSLSRYKKFIDRHWEDFDDLHRTLKSLGIVRRVFSDTSDSRADFKIISTSVDSLESLEILYDIVSEYVNREIRSPLDQIMVFYPDIVRHRDEQYQDAEILDYIDAWET